MDMAAVLPAHDVAPPRAQAGPWRRALRRLLRRRPAVVGLAVVGLFIALALRPDAAELDLGAQAAELAGPAGHCR